MIIQRNSRPAHSVGVKIAIPHSRFTPTPTMKPLEVAFYRGQEAKRLGRAMDHPYTDLLASAEGGELVAAWEKGYNS